MKPSFFCALLIFFSKVIAFSQPLPDSIALQKGISNVQSFYEKSLEGTSNLYNGAEYIEYQPLDDEHPFFLSDDWVLGKVKYDGEMFLDIYMLYDIQRGKLILSNYSNGSKMQLVNELIDEFELDGHHFINVKKTDDSLSMRVGFYEELYAGNTQILARRFKQLSEKINGTDLSRNFEETNQYYLKYKGKFSRITGKRGMFKTLMEKKKELKVFVHRNKLFVRNRESSIVQTAQYFDSLIP